MNSLKSHVGILGDGQLARMMMLEAHKMGLLSTALTHSVKSSAAQVGSYHILSSSSLNINDLTLFSDFISKSPHPVLTIESEFIDPELLIELQNRRSIKIYPKPEHLREMRDRLFQKKLLKKFRIPTSPLLEIRDLKDVEELMNEKYPPNPRKGIVLKKRLFGYDGYGTLILSKNDYKEQFPQNFSPRDWIAEDFVLFRKEMAISFAINPRGQVCDFPAVETYQSNSKCLWVKGPITENKGLNVLRKDLTRMLQDLNYVGFITFEIFLTQKGDYLVNEVAPRVHNSAHYSLEALYLNQFKAHLLTILDFDIPEKAQVISPFAMYNIIGEWHKNLAHLPEGHNQHFLHWYGKEDTRPGRKMGHITTLSSTSEEALRILKVTMKSFEKTPPSSQKEASPHKNLKSQTKSSADPQFPFKRGHGQHP